MHGRGQTGRAVVAMLCAVALLAACGGTPEEAARDLRLTATAAAPAFPPTRAVSVASAAVPGVASAAAPTTGSATAGGTKPVANATAPASATPGGTPRAPTSGDTVASTTTSTARGTGIAATGTTGTAGSTPRGTFAAGVFAGANGRYSFRAPSQWRGQKSANRAVEIEIVSDAPAAYLRTASQVTAVAVSLDGATKVITDSLRRSVTGFEEAPGGPREAMIGGQRAKRIEYTGTDHGTHLRYVTYVVVHDQTLVVSLFFIAQPGDLDAALTQGMMVLNTFAFT